MPREVNQDFDISIHYSGEITDSHKLGLRTYANTLKHFSAAVDRAILSESRGNIHKFARITHDEREDLEFTVLDPEDGGIILKFLSSRNNQLARRVAERMANYIKEAYNQEPQASITPKQIREKIADLQQQEEIEANAPPEADNDFAKKAICREVNSILSEIRTEAAGQSWLEFELKTPEPGRVERFHFDRAKAERFNQVVMRRNIVGPYRYTIRVRGLDLVNEKKPYAKCLDVTSGISRTVYFKDEEDLQKLRDYLSGDDAVMVSVIGFSITEFGVVDNLAGDIHFIDVA
ncbi:hypothetical protein [Idiomarina sp. UBA3162]|uniref:hypothetical protein n=1 Tax=Idiomarina sp. UBA3162 TaxID=1946641 RepID=UPI000C9468F7|nr:hypothetical protein [Idiomarina sp. UBA3162]MAD52841.1 hypothetical protein [Idiomarinaceae bacterium]|tara:strand:+ start:1585 stop:2457 length:873 start_codon:yes stop_codon:yes gene_type:complete